MFLTRIHIRLHCFLALVIAVALSGTCFSGTNLQETKTARLQINIASDATVTSGKIYLKDIARISGPDGLRQQAEELFIANAPAPGIRKRIIGSFVKARITAGSQVPANAIINLPGTVSVVRRFQEISDKKIEKIFKDHVTAKTQGSEFSISKIRITGKRKLPLGKISLTTTAFTNQKLAGPVSLGVNVWVDGTCQARTRISGWIARFAMAVKTTRSVKRGGLLSKDNIELFRVNVTKAPTGIINTFEHADGMMSRRTLKPGTIITDNMLEKPRLISRGDVVKLIAKKGHLTISTLGIAKSNGAIGDQIKVENVKSGKIVIGKATGKSTVLVLF